MRTAIGRQWKRQFGRGFAKFLEDAFAPGLRVEFGALSEFRDFFHSVGPKRDRQLRPAEVRQHPVHQFREFVVGQRRTGHSAHVDQESAAVFAVKKKSDEVLEPGDSFFYALAVGQGHDTANMTATTTIRGDVAFGDGSSDSLTFSTCRQADINETNNACAGESLSLGDLTLDHTGAFTGLEQISKIGSGTLRLTDLTSQGSTMALQDGDLRLRGHLDLGSSGTLTIHDASRLIFGKTASDHDRITASTVQINDSALRLYAEAADSLAIGNDVLLGSGVFHNSAGNAATPTLLNVADNTALGSFTSGGVVSLDEGGLLLKGHLDLGRDGQLHILDPSRLMFGTPDRGPGHGSITASHVVFMGPWEDGERVYATDSAAERLDGRSVLNAGYFVNADTDQPVHPTLYDESGRSEIGWLTPDGQVTLSEGERPTDPDPVRPPTDCPEGRACITDPGIGRDIYVGIEPVEPVVLVDLVVPVDPVDPVAPVIRVDSDNGARPPWSELAPDPQPTAGFAASLMMRLTTAALTQAAGSVNSDVGVGGAITDFKSWAGSSTVSDPSVRAFTGNLAYADAGGLVSGLSFGMVADFGNGLRFTSVLAEHAQTESADGRSWLWLTGDVWSGRLGWSDGGLFAAAAVALGRSSARSIDIDAFSGDMLDGLFDTSQAHAEATAGYRFSAGGLFVAPSISGFAGTLSHDAHTAQGRVVLAELPSFTQRYSGWRAGLELGTEDWRPATSGLRWRPHLRAEWEHASTTGPSTVKARKSDRAGVLSFVVDEHLAGLASEVARVHLGAELQGDSDAWGLTLGLSSEWLDGRSLQAAHARFTLRF